MQGNCLVSDPETPIPAQNTAAASAQPARKHLFDADVLALGFTIAVGVLVIGVGGSLLARRFVPNAPGWLGSTVIVLVLGLAVVGARLFGQLHSELRTRSARAAQDHLHALTDPLTGCYNRRSIGPASETLMAAAAEHDEAIAVIMIDVDNFKQINDSYGHRMGDAVLATCAARIAAQLPTGSVMARLGGDEFACVLSYPAAHPHLIDKLANAIILETSALLEISNGESGSYSGSVTVSLGLAHSEAPRAPGDARSLIDALLHHADLALYQAKKAGRNRYLWFAENMEDALRHRCQIEAGIREGLTRGEFMPYFQPIVELSSGALVGFEMLARWQSPRFGLIEPDNFIAIAEEIGLIAELSEALMSVGMREARSWDGDLTLSVNISAEQLRDPWFAQKMLKLLQVERFPRTRLEIEISETCLHSDITGVTTLISSLKNQGISLCLDDFGMGFSSLSQLRGLHFDRLKLHRGLISNRVEDSDSRAIVESIVTLGRGLGLPIVVEGVDSASLAAELAAMGDFRGQGYYFGEPLPADETRALIEQLHAGDDKTGEETGEEPTPPTLPDPLNQAPGARQPPKRRRSV